MTESTASKSHIVVAVSQGEVAGANLAAEVESRDVQAEYDHKTMLALDQAGQDSILSKHFWMNKVRSIKPRDLINAKA